MTEEVQAESHDETEEQNYDAAFNEASGVKDVVEEVTTEEEPIEEGPIEAEPQESDPWAGVPDALRDQYNQAQQAYSDLDQKFKRNSGQVSALQKKINELEKKPSANEVSKALESPEGWKTFEDEFPDIAKAIDTRMSSLEQRIGETVQSGINQSTEPLRKAEYARHQQQEVAALEAAHPGWATTRHSIEFKQWLNEQPDAYREMANSTERAADLSAVFGHFKTRPPPASGANEVKTGRDARLQRAVSAPGKSQAAPKPIAADDFGSAFDHFAKQSVM